MTNKKKLPIYIYVKKIVFSVPVEHKAKIHPDPCACWHNLMHAKQ